MNTVNLGVEVAAMVRWLLWTLDLNCVKGSTELGTNLLQEQSRTRYEDE